MPLPYKANADLHCNHTLTHTLSTNGDSGVAAAVLLLVVAVVILSHR